VSGTATDARQASVAARQAAGTRELAAGTATDAREASLPARTAAGAVVLASGSAVAVGVAATTAWVVLEDNVGGCQAGHRWSSSNNISGGRGCGGNRCSDSPGHDQWFHGD
jgi:hypothetical protein